VPQEIELPKNGCIEPDETIEVFVDAITPNASGMYSAFWRVTIPAGDPISVRLRFRVLME